MGGVGGGGNVGNVGVVGDCVGDVGICEAVRMASGVSITVSPARVCRDLSMTCLMCRRFALSCRSCSADRFGGGVAGTGGFGTEVVELFRR